MTAEGAEKIMFSLKMLRFDALAAAPITASDQDQTGRWRSSHVPPAEPEAWFVISLRLTGRLRRHRNPHRVLFLPLPRRERTEVRVPIGLPPHPYLLPPGEKEPMLDALTVSKRKAPYRPRRKPYSRKSQTLGVPQQSWGFTFD